MLGKYQKTMNLYTLSKAKTIIGQLTDRAKCIYSSLTKRLLFAIRPTGLKTVKESVRLGFARRMNITTQRLSTILVSKNGNGRSTSAGGYTKAVQRFSEKRTIGILKLNLK